MVDVINLKPSEINAMRTGALAQEQRESVLKGISILLDNLPDDEGPSADTIYSTAIVLSRAGFWKLVDEAELLEVLLQAPVDAATVFMEGLPSELKGGIAVDFIKAKSELEAAHFEGWDQIDDIAEVVYRSSDELGPVNPLKSPKYMVKAPHKEMVFYQKIPEEFFSNTWRSRSGRGPDIERTGNPPPPPSSEIIPPVVSKRDGLKQGKFRIFIKER